MATRTVVMNVIGATPDALVVGVHLVLIYGLVGLGAGLALGLIVALVRRSLPPGTVFAWCLGLTLALYVFLSGNRLYNQDLYFYDYPYIQTFRQMQIFFAARVVGTLAVAAGAGYAVIRLARRAPGRVGLALVGLVLAVGLVFNLLAREPERQTTTQIPALGPDPTVPGILMVGWDGATWAIMDRLIAEGKMPNTRQLIEAGCRSNLRTPSNTVSADVWTSIYTGKAKRQHGIYGFDYYAVPGLRKAIVPPWRGLGITRILRFLLERSWIEVIIANRTLCRATPIWRIMNDVGRSAGVVGPLVSWPAEEIEPFLVTSTAGDIARKVRRGSLDREAFVSGELFSPPDLDASAVEEMLREPRWRDAVGISLYRKYRPDFFTAYFEEPDRTQHIRWKWMEPRYFSGITEEGIAKHGLDIEREYLRADSLLGEYMEIAGDTTTVIVLSDHGFSPTYRGGRQCAGHYGGPDGILIAAGPPIRRGATVDRPHVNDITPTVLALAGVPVAADMAGRVLDEIIEPAYLEEHPVRTVPTYETGPSELTVRRSDAEADLYEKLRALGYVGG